MRYEQNNRRLSLRIADPSVSLLVRFRRYSFNSSFFSSSRLFLYPCLLFSASAYLGEDNTHRIFHSILSFFDQSLSFFLSHSLSLFSHSLGYLSRPFLFDSLAHARLALSVLDFYYYSHSLSFTLSIIHSLPQLEEAIRRALLPRTMFFSCFLRDLLVARWPHAVRLSLVNNGRDLLFRFARATDGTRAR